jgi:uncharacterized protein (UPF0276 family)
MATTSSRVYPSIPARAGVGFKPTHFDAIFSCPPDLGWFEVHPENYMGAGGAPHHQLSRIREKYPLSLHGIGLSIGGPTPLNTDHLDRFKALIDRYEPGLVSEHLAWSTHDTAFLNDLLPLPYTPETLALVSAHVDQTQSHLGQRILLENPATYVVFEESSYDEIDFLSEIVKRTGCGLLLDVNNVYVSCTNHKRDAQAYIDAFPICHVGEIHLAGHAEDQDDAGQRLLIDTHDRRVIDDVWALYGRAMSRAGAIPTLVEWDEHIPDWPVLLEEARRAETILQDVSQAGTRAMHAPVMEYMG